MEAKSGWRGQAGMALSAILRYGPPCASTSAAGEIDSAAARANSVIDDLILDGPPINA